MDLTPLANRLRKRRRQLRRWAARRDLTCYRLYERDIGEAPLIVDWYDGDAVVWIFDRTRDTSPEDRAAWEAAVPEAVSAGLDLPLERLHLKHRGRQRGTTQYHRLDRAGTRKVVHEQGLRFEVALDDYLDTGLFLDHRRTRDRVRAEAAGQRILNLFAYTGTFTCYAAAGGAADSLTVDLNPHYLDWAARNLALNDCHDPERHRQERTDCLEFLDRPWTPRFDLVVCDPPTFSNSKRMQRAFAVAKDQVWLLNRCHALLRSGGILYFSTNARGFDLVTSGILPFRERIELTPDSIDEDFRNRRIHRCWRLVK